MLKDFRDLLLADVALTGLLGQTNGRASIDFILRPDTGGLPAITLNKISEPISYNQMGRSVQEMQRVQVDIWGSAFIDVENVHKALRVVCEALTGDQGDTHFNRVFEDSARDMPVTDLPGGTRVYHRAVDYIIHYQES